MFRKRVDCLWCDTISGDVVAATRMPEPFMTPGQQPNTNALLPGPLPYHQAIVRYLKAEEPGLWDWFASTKMRDEQGDAVRLDLLRSTYRIEAASQPRLSSAAEEITNKFELKIPITFYQAQSGESMNASLAYLPGEAHVVFAGPVLDVLSDLELCALLGHELAHFLLLDRWDGEYRIAAELLRSLSNDAAASPAHHQSVRLFGLYTEVFADRGALAMTVDPIAAITTLLKMTTGLAEVSAESYLRQAEEIFSKSRDHAQQLTHPEPYIRARALDLWARHGDDAGAGIEAMIEGPLSLDRLDLLGQRKVAALTRRLLGVFLAPEWFHSERVLAHARLFFDDFDVEQPRPDEATLIEELKSCDESLRAYVGYVLLDFVAVDRELSSTALAAAIVLARQFDLAGRFVEIAQKELGLSKKQVSKIEREVAAKP
jgi:Zn-dependent protease with chaperone function